MVSERIPIDESEKFHPEQWVKLYGVTGNRHEYINTCQIDQLETVIGGIQHSWWDNYLLEPVDEKEQPISLEEAIRRGNEGGEGKSVF